MGLWWKHAYSFSNTVLMIQSNTAHSVMVENMVSVLHGRSRGVMFGSFFNCMRLHTICEVGDVRREWCAADVDVGNVQVNIELSFRRFEESHEACGKWGHEDRQHPKIQNVPQVHDVLARTVHPDLFTLGPDHSWNTHTGGLNPDFTLQSQRMRDILFAV